MEFITFNAENTVSARKGEAYISFSRKGANSISKAAVEITGFEHDDLIGIHQDKDNQADWYISLAEGGFKLRDDKNQGTLFFNNTAMTHTLLDALDIEEDRAAFFIAKEPTVIEDVNYWAILTSKPIIKKQRKKK